MSWRAEHNVTFIIEFKELSVMLISAPKEPEKHRRQWQEDCDHGQICHLCDGRDFWTSDIWNWWYGGTFVVGRHSCIFVSSSSSGWKRCSLQWFNIGFNIVIVQHYIKLCWAMLIWPALLKIIGQLGPNASFLFSKNKVTQIVFNRPNHSLEKLSCLFHS